MCSLPQAKSLSITIYPPFTFFHLPQPLHSGHHHAIVLVFGGGLVTKLTSKQNTTGRQLSEGRGGAGLGEKGEDIKQNKQKKPTTIF